ncbi:hypothetical protein PAAG_12026 [Paracoccidioides lutzii Pb01]|uniref:Uncharacterized protein n=1 Tax=Paracoccidioides lutzii (strain ATCC MYA-826 / Pb01) TaxID=502779 RepID=A0A0A2V550_PARBA|nr:hypothetical protein PAAG_12026 [Paracoccidioides lutzii Pb01]KGQ01255.1 hypothetical protein PAAG_12026 [Paracoccidioides lutzii Pb01]
MGETEDSRHNEITPTTVLFSRGNPEAFETSAHRICFPGSVAFPAGFPTALNRSWVEQEPAPDTMTNGRNIHITSNAIWLSGFVRCGQIDPPVSYSVCTRRYDGDYGGTVA